MEDASVVALASLRSNILLATAASVEGGIGEKTTAMCVLESIKDGQSPSWTGQYANSAHQSIEIRLWGCTSVTSLQTGPM
ncbi:hypothetical protein DFH94DRAFT_746605 [Russula ochroleuca]|uniref:Uncharacterized protein n=1 Tax=Russula ochroleuca TaxID=152965 RepID=A0A9P5MUC0_9AGAM|nr:hypothetical protein DFH94DRAFT_746605 [Russula ochroleuca]